MTGSAAGPAGVTKLLGVYLEGTSVATAKADLELAGHDEVLAGRPAAEDGGRESTLASLRMDLYSPTVARWLATGVRIDSRQ